uniref:Uncharacterized protein n=1 Tax=Ficedula albicollis TaxID=59894 RepID=A0A803VZT8_FICAL
MTSMLRGCQRKLPLGVPPGMESPKKSNLLLRSKFVIHLFLALILKLFHFIHSNSRL